VSSLPRAKKALFWALMLSLPAASAAGLFLFWRHRMDAPPAGKKLNRAAWEASFTERGLVVPAKGPRDGYWGKNMPPWTRDPEVGWHESEVHLRGLVDQDRSGVQRYGTPGARWHLLVLGGSVAWGAYASSIEETYFAHLARRLHEGGRPVRVTVMAAGAWTSENELKAFRGRGVEARPDVVLFLNGMNDLTQGKGISEEARVRAYLDRMHEARDIAQTKGIVAVFALQPALAGKRRKSPLEARVLELMADKSALVPSAFPRMLTGLKGLATEAGAYALDCSNAFSAESATTFTDVWHFADPGHRLLAECLSRGLAPVLDAHPSRPHS
jgi:lysophospholipase L1-like esterase